VIGQLPIPPGAASAARAKEIARIWAAEGKQHVSLSTNMWSDPGAWGIMLSDLARHVANAYAQKDGLSSAEVLKRIKSVLDLEWGSPTDAPEGGLLR
jgi:hypothetical protein